MFFRFFSLFSRLSCLKNKIFQYFCIVFAFSANAQGGFKKASFLMIFTSDVIVLRSFMFTDTKMMVDVLSATEGRMSCVLKTSARRGARGRKRQPGGSRQLFQPLAMLELQLERKAAGQLAVIKEAQMQTAFSSIPFDPYKLAISIFLSEFLCNVTWSEHDAALLFEYISESILWLDSVKEGFSNFHLVFMMRLTKFIGFYPNLDDYRDGCSFDMQNGCFVETTAAHPSILGADDAKKLQLLMRMNYGNMHLFMMSHTDRNRCLDVILDYYSLHVPDFREMKSLDVLRELFR